MANALCFRDGHQTLGVRTQLEFVRIVNGIEQLFLHFAVTGPQLQVCIIKGGKTQISVVDANLISAHCSLDKLKSIIRLLCFTVSDPNRVAFAAARSCISRRNALALPSVTKGVSLTRGTFHAPPGFIVIFLPIVTFFPVKFQLEVVVSWHHRRWDRWNTRGRHRGGGRRERSGRA